MAFSAHEGKEFFKDWLTNFAAPLQFKRVLDIGCGAGWYGKILRDVFKSGITIDAVEIFSAYIDRHSLRAIYDQIIVNDIMSIYKNLPNYDLIIMGDVLEHLPKPQAIELVKGVRGKSRFLWCALPLIVEGKAWSTGYRQGPEDFTENPANKHWHDWTLEEVKKEFDPLWVVPYIQTGMFLVEGDIR